MTLDAGRWIFAAGLRRPDGGTASTPSSRRDPPAFADPCAVGRGFSTPPLSLAPPPPSVAAERGHLLPSISLAMIDGRRSSRRLSVGTTRHDATTPTPRRQTPRRHDARRHRAPRGKRWPPSGAAAATEGGQTCERNEQGGGNHGTSPSSRADRPPSAADTPRHFPLVGDPRFPSPRRAAITGRAHRPSPPDRRSRRRLRCVTSSDPLRPAEEMNLGVKQARTERRSADALREERVSTSPTRSASGDHRVLHRPRGSAAHARLRQEVPAEGGQPDLRRELGARLLGAARVSDLRLALDWSAFYWLPSRRLRAGQGAGVRRVLGRDGTAIPVRPPRAAQALPPRALGRAADRLSRRARDRGAFLFKGRDAERHYHETGVQYVSTGGYPLAAGRLAPHLHRHRRRGAAGDGLQNEKDHPRSPRRSSR